MLNGQLLLLLPSSSESIAVDMVVGAVLLGSALNERNVVLEWIGN